MDTVLAPGCADGVSGNDLLDQLTPAQRRSLLADAQSVPLAPCETLTAATAPLSHLYFPSAGLVAVVGHLDREVEIGSVGREGCVGAEALLGRDSPAGTRSIVRLGGSAWRVPLDCVRRLADKDRDLHFRLLRYIHAFLTEMAETVVTTASLTIAQRVARWIVVNADRARTDFIPVTHQEISAALSTRRASVTISLHHLESAHAIKAGRRAIEIVDRRRLVAAVNEAPVA